MWVRIYKYLVDIGIWIKVTSYLPVRVWDRVQVSRPYLLSFDVQLREKNIKRFNANELLNNHISEFDTTFKLKILKFRFMSLILTYILLNFLIPT